MAVLSDTVKGVFQKSSHRIVESLFIEALVFPIENLSDRRAEVFTCRTVEDILSILRRVDGILKECQKVCL